MKLFRFAIVDDSQTEAESLKGTLLSFMQKNGLAVSVDVFTKPLPFLDSFSCNYDIIFLDIEMPLMDGISLAKAIREKDELVTLVFVTNLAQFALDAFAVSASDYLLKPISPRAFELKMSRLLRKMAPGSDERFLIRTGGTTKAVPLFSIDYVEASNHHVIYHVGNETYLAYERMKDVENRLPNFFAKCNRYYLVNLLKVTSIQGDSAILGDSGSELKMSRNEKKSFLERFSQYYSQRRSQL